jgi:hypothetical protein
MEIESEIESLFLVHDYRWKIDGVLRYPTSEEIRQTIDRAVEELYHEQDGTQLEVGRLIIKKSQGHYDVYAMIGEGQ